VVGAAVLAVLAGVAACYAPPPAEAAITTFTVSPAAGPPGTVVHVSGAGCNPGLLGSAETDFVSVSAYAGNKPATLPFATRLQFKFAQLRAGEKLTTGLIQLAPGADFRQARYRIPDSEGGSSWKSLE